VIPDLLLAFATGVVGSLHCLGMCGPLVVAYSLHLRPEGGTGAAEPWTARWSRGLAHHLSFHAGRIMTYGFLGALAAGLVHVGTLNKSFMSARTVTAIAGGIAMILFGLILLKAIPLRFTSPAAMPSRDSVAGRLIRRGLRLPGPRSGWFLGLAAGFLPCILSWAMVIKAATIGSAPGGFLFMTLFGVGTAPLLIFTGLSASLFSLRMRLAGERIAALSVIVMGVILVVKGVTRLA
jgi:uncharacterized protein